MKLINKKLFTLGLLLTAALTVHGQQHRPWAYHWIFGNGAHITFNDTGIVKMDSIYFRRPSNPTNTYIDSSGQLIYYLTFDSATVNNKTYFSIHNANGVPIVDSLPLPFNLFGCLNIVKFKNNDTLYNYMIAVRNDTSNIIPSTLICIKIVVDSINHIRYCGYNKNIHIFNYTGIEDPLMIRHANGKDWWLIVGDPLHLNKFYRFLITAKTVLGPVVINTKGTDTMPNYTGGDGFFKCSLSGNLIARLGNRVALYDFNRCTGAITYNYISAPFQRYYPDTSFYYHKKYYYDREVLWSYYGAAFSPDDKYLYITSPFNLYRAETHPKDTTKALKKVFTNTLSHPAFPEVLMMGMELGSDNRMYIAESPVFFTTPNNVVNNPLTKYLHRVRPIHNSWDSVVVDTNYVCLGTKCNYWMLPSFPNYGLDTMAGATGCDTLNGTKVSTEAPNHKETISKMFTIYPNPNSGVFTVNYTVLPDTKNAELTITNLPGAELNTYAMPVNSNQYKIVDLVLSEGMYICQLYTNGKLSGTARLVIIK